MQKGKLKYKEAVAIELIHKYKKDEELLEYIYYLLNNVFQNTSLIKNQTYVIKLTGRVIYYYICYILNNRSLGEEFSYLLPFNKLEKIFINKKRLFIYFSLKSFFHLFIEKFGNYTLKKIKFYSREIITKKMKKKEKKFYFYFFLMNLPEFSYLMNHFEDLHTSLFFFNTKFYEFENQISNILYINNFPSNSEKFNYKPIFLLILATKIIKFIFFLKKIRNKIKDFQIEKKIHEEIPEKINEKYGDNICKICYDKREFSSLTECGHLFCWNCILKYSRIKSECPLCRSIISPKKILLLNNFN